MFGVVKGPGVGSYPANVGSNPTPATKLEESVVRNSDQQQSIVALSFNGRTRRFERRNARSRLAGASIKYEIAPPTPAR